jgi:hypothetical protein
VVTLSVLLTLATVAVNRFLTGGLGVVFDVGFVLICVAAALSVRPRDFFVVGVLPPLLMFGVLLALAMVTPGTVAQPNDSAPQAVVSGLAYHAGALVTGYGLTLAALALRQYATRNAGRLRASRREVSSST